MIRLLLCIGLAVGSAALAYTGWEMATRGWPHSMIQGNDDAHYYFWLRSAVIDGDWDFANDLRTTPMIDPADRQALAEGPLTPAGRTPNKYPLGWALVNLPFFLVGHAWCLLSGGTADGWQPAYQYAVYAGHLLYSLAGLLLARRLLRRFLPAEAADLGVLAGWLGSSLLYYQTARAGMVHGSVFFLVVACFELTFRLRENLGARGCWLWLGLAAALLVVTRPTAVVYLLFPVWVVVVLAWQDFRAGRPAGLVGPMLAVVAALPIVGLQLLAWKKVYGAWLLYSYGGERFDFLQPELSAVLFSPHHGWFYWHPLLLPGFLAFVWLALRRRVPPAWFVSALAIIYLNAAWWCWWFGSSFGNRAFEGATLFCMLGLGYLWSLASSPWPRRIAGIVLFTAIAYNILLLGFYLNGIISRSQPVTYSDVISSLLTGR